MMTERLTHGKFQRQATCKYFEDITVGDTFDYPSVTFSREMRDRHVALYGEDWPAEIVAAPRDDGIIPGPMLMSVLGGLWGRHGFIRIRFLKEIAIKFHHPIYTGDTIRAVTEVVDVRPHRDPTKKQGHIFLHQEIFNQAETLCCTRDLCFVVEARGETDTSSR